MWGSACVGDMNECTLIMYSDIITTNCLRLQAMATMDGNLEKATELQEQLDELEERAQELDRMRSSNISSIR